MENIVKKSKILFIIVLLAMTLAICINVVANTTTDTYKVIGSKKDSDGNIIFDSDNHAKSDTYEIKVDDEVTFRNWLNEKGTGYNNQLFGDNPNLYCVQHSWSIGSNPTYKVASRTEVVDPELAYILNLDGRKSGERHIRHELKQHLIWWYIYNYKGTRDEAKLILDGIQDTHELPSGRDLLWDNGKNKGWWNTKNHPTLTDGTQIATSPKKGSALYNEWQNARAYKNKLEALKISIDNIELVEENVVVEISGTFDSFNIYINSEQECYKENLAIDNLEILDEAKQTKGIKIPLSNFKLSENEGYAKVYVEGKMTKYKASFMILKNSDKQRIILIDTKGTEVETTGKVSDKIKCPTDVSLQKYIIKVNGNDLTTENTSLTERINKRTWEKETRPDLVKDAISKNNDNKVVEADHKNYKRDNAVQIEAGDTVTYRIHVYNNSDFNATNVLVKDAMSYIKDDNGNFVDSYSTIGYTDENGNFVDSYSAIVYTDANGKSSVVTWSEDDNTKNINSYMYTIPELEANTEVYFDITVKYNKYSPDILTNTAWISSTDQKNITEYRTGDRDYVEMKKYSVSLEKFITAVNTNAVEGREGHRYNQDLKDVPDGTIPNKDLYKNNNKVNVEAGDRVTYTIRLQNTGDIPVKVTQIYDSFTSYTGRKLTIHTDSAKMYNSAEEEISATLEFKSGYCPEGWNLNNLERYLITISGIQSLNPGDYVDIKIDFTVEITSDYIGDNTTLANKAGIVELKNGHGVVVTDSDGFGNNRDKDWVITKTYSVSLEKYVTEVTDKDGNNKVTYNNREGYRFNKKVLESERKETGTEDEINYSPYKNKNKVQVEAGDIVTFTIKLKNTGDSPVKVTQIYDTYRKHSDGYSLVYEESYGIQGNGGGKITDDSYQTTNPEWANEESNRYLIAFDNAITIDPGKSEYVTIKFKVDIPTRLTNTTLSEDLYNLAGIVEIKNSHDILVQDGDGLLNNYDMDFLQPKLYAVSLEKYVSKVIDSNGNITDYSFREGKAQHKYDNDDKTSSKEKYNKPVTVSKGNEVIYTIKLTNDGNTKVNITNIADYFPNGVKYGGASFTGDVYCTTYDNGQTDNIRNFTMGIELLPGESKSFEISVEVIEPNVSLNLLKNVAEITEMKNRNGVVVLDTTGNNNKDADYIQLDWDSTTIDVAVEKKWEDNNNQLGKRPTSIKVQLYRNNEVYGQQITLTANNNWEHVWENLAKYDNDENEYVYTVKEVSVLNGYVSTYAFSENKTTIINTYNDEPTPEYISKTVIKEWLYDLPTKRPSSITVKLYKNNTVLDTVELNESNKWTYTWNELEKFDDNGNEYIYTVQESNIPEYYKVEYQNADNVFIIRNKYDAPDSPDVIIGGYIWNDIAFDKAQNDYNGQLDSEKEKMLEGIKVYLYREGITNPVAVKETNSKGYYGFTNADIDTVVVTEAHKRHIKAEKIEGTQRWSTTYYSYYVVFEYDGITYTSTPDGQSSEDIINSSKDYQNDSNAREDYGKVKETRDDFNKKFNTINNESGLSYTTKNENGYIPQSNHVYDESIMAMQSSTNLISFSNLLSEKDYSDEKDLADIQVIENKLKHVGLGLRGKDIFDLELTSDVDNVKVTVNNQQGVYRYSNKVTLRQKGLNLQSTVDEDMANKGNETSNMPVDAYVQNIREGDFDVSKTGANGTAYNKEQRLQTVEVTYKVTVQNTSLTKGAVTKITNYFDDAYNAVKRVYSENSDLGITVGESGNGYKSIIITTPGTILSQSETMEIYITYLLNLEALNGLTKENPIPTFNMTEIAEYTTVCAEGQTEYTRGLMDKDSAPGSANKEQVRLTTTEGQNTATTNGNPTTVDYYFAASELDKLKYEDDTYAAPTLFFAVTEENERTIIGKVFRDETKVNPITKIKTGNGVLDEGEAPVYGATVELVEKVDVNAEDFEGIIRYTTTTEKDGSFIFTGFLPGEYIIRYRYGNSKETILLNQNGDVNAYSFNGEDYQSTNNAYKRDGMDTNQLSTMPNFWYVYNEEKGISTANDNEDRRKIVTNNVLNDSNNIMAILNEIRAGNNENYTTSLAEKTYMYANTKLMTLTVEKTELVGEGENQELKQREQFSDYKISNMNFGIAEVPVTTIDLQKEVQGFQITDSVGENVLAAAMKKEDGTWEVQGDVIALDGQKTISAQIEDEKLQGARLQVTYAIKSNMKVELNYDKTGGVEATITEFFDIIDNNMSYNSILGNNSTFWVEQANLTKSSIPNIDNYANKVKASDMALNKLNRGEEITITLEKILSSTNATIEEIITSTVDFYEYQNIVEITGLNYKNVTQMGVETDTAPQEDRIRTSDRYIIIPGEQHDIATSETVAITPPTGNGSMDITYYVIAAISLMVLAVGVFGIKKFVVNTKK